MITSAYYIDFIVKTLNVLRQEIISRSKVGITDNNIALENFACDLLNKLYGYNLVNLNKIKKNYPGIDLGDSTNGIGVQITRTGKSSKIKETITKVKDHKCYEEFPHLKFLILTQKQQSYTFRDISDLNLKFNSDKDILDFDDLYIRALYLSISTQKEIAEYLHDQIPFVSKSIGFDYYGPEKMKRLVHEFTESSWDTGELIIEHNFGYLPQVTVMDSDGATVITSIKSTEKTVTLNVSLGVKFSGKVLLT